MKFLFALAGACMLMCIGATPASAQATPDTAKALRVFVDCGSCDLDYIRTEMPWVDYMRDRADAQLHILVTQEGTGGGGSQYTLNFIGLKEFAARNDTLRYLASVNDSQDEIRKGLTRLIQIGVLPFIAGSPTARLLKFSLEAAGGVGKRETAKPQKDPWNFWTFRVGFSGYGQGQSQSSSSNLNGSISANRTTADWKISLSASKSQNEQKFKFPDDDGVEQESKFTTKSASVSELIVRSLGSNFSAGLSGSLGTSSFSNTKRSISIQPAIEYDFFPYSESNRRMLTALYSIGLNSFQYADTTIYLKTEETHPQHSLSLGYNTQEPWGSAYVSANYSEYLHDRSLYNAGIFASTDIRLFKGFSLNFSGDYSKVQDQLSLKKGDLTRDEILLKQRAQRTDYSYFVSAGISYRFGSIFNNVVNPRFGSSGGGGQIIIMH